MNIFTRYFSLLVLLSFPVKSNGLNGMQNASAINEFKRPFKKLKLMGISINLYRIAKAEHIDDVKNIDSEMKKARANKVDLYKMTEDLAIIFLNKPDPWADVN